MSTMEEANKTSMKLDFEAVRKDTIDKDNETTKESYKRISESDAVAENNKKEEPKTTMPKENGNSPQSSEEDEKMLNGSNGSNGSTADGAGDKEVLTQKNEVKFQSESQNGDAKIDIDDGPEKKEFSGLTKDELKKFANDPFWIKLRWFLFIFFWLLWVFMLVAAIYIIISAPKCAAPEPLVWYKLGPLVKVDAENYKNQIDELAAFKTTGVVVELPPEETYIVETNENVHNKIKELVKTFKEKDINVVLDITPNFVTKEDPLFAAAETNQTIRNAFIWSQMGDLPTNWKSVVVPKTSAWSKIGSVYYLSQFGENHFDLQLKNEIAKEKLKSVLKYLVKLGVKGFRLANAKYFIVGDIKNEEASIDQGNHQMDEYEFWTHKETTYQDGLAELLHELARDVHNGTAGEGFLSVSEDIYRPEVFKLNEKVMTIDIPIYGRLPDLLNREEEAIAIQMHKEIENVYDGVGDSSWVQWSYNSSDFQHLDSSAYNMFMMLLPGVPVVPLDVLMDNSTKKIAHELTKMRHENSFMHGTFSIFNNTDGHVIGYSKLKPGAPGIFVVLNPTKENVTADFSHVDGLPFELTVHLKSNNYNIPEVTDRYKMATKEVRLSPLSVLVCTYVVSTD